MSHPDNPLITICIPHWQSEEFMKPCLRSIRKHSEGYPLQVIVIDNGSKDKSLDYLRSLEWIELIERPEERPDNWPRNVFTAWDRGLGEAKGKYYLTMHSDVFIRSDDWLSHLIEAIESKPAVVASGSWKLELKHPLYRWQKRVLGGACKRFKKNFLGKNPRIDTDAGRYPRDYCAMYDTDFLKKHDIVFAIKGKISGGHQVATQIWQQGGETVVFPVETMAGCLAHIAHGTSAISSEINLRRISKQNKTIEKKVNLFNEKWILALTEDASLDR